MAASAGTVFAVVGWVLFVAVLIAWGGRTMYRTHAQQKAIAKAMRSMNSSAVAILEPTPLEEIQYHTLKELPTTPKETVRMPEPVHMKPHIIALGINGWDDDEDSWCMSPSYASFPGGPQELKQACELPAGDTETVNENDWEDVHTIAAQSYSGGLDGGAQRRL
ncbi:hypothetical protein M011DRAFT_478317 [Sporormia fimetaria CBS 119925]|uniref:Uncharacterized protein n=1 Tax=Sporormia fimetaria CBS 119925 TaxID=1340428 RepID=A0A6A6V8B9_9PLEO|nr:hypothetical protein M011DRAFT_478317 [Sporormia fimetaria CBS 119925]